MKKLSYGFHFSNGRNRGLISSYHRGGGNKKQLRLIDRFRCLYNVSAKVVDIQYDPTRSAKISLVLYTNGIVSYLPAIQGLKIGSYVKSITSIAEEQAPSFTQTGLSCPLRFVKTGFRVCSIEFYPTYGSAVARSAGLFATLVRKYNDVALLRLSSGELRFFSLDCFCTIGTLLARKSSLDFVKAGVNRWAGWRPVVRGRAMNPVDHPHGGRTNGGMTPTTPWARWVKGQKTSRSTSTLRLRPSNL
jgi:large subunit ribosomal protein L2